MSWRRFPFFSSPHLKTLNPNPRRWISSLKVAWRKDPSLDAAIEGDKRRRLCARVVREVLNEPGQRIPLRYLDKRRHRLRLPVRIPAFLSRHPLLFDQYPDRIKPRTQPVPFLRPSHKLLSFLSQESKIRAHNAPRSLAKLCKLLMLSQHRTIPVDKLLHVKRVFGLPDDFLTSLVPQHPHLLRCSPSFLELVSWNDEYAKSIIEIKSEEENQLTGIRMRPNFTIRLPDGFFLRKEMREWMRNWLELPYISPYADASGLHQASPEMEKRSVGLLHEVLSLSILKRIEVPVIGKFCDEFRLSNSFANTFTRHSGIFYVSLKGGVKTAMLREAYDKDVLVDRDPLLEIDDKFVELVEGGHKEWKERMKAKREAVQKEMELVAKRNSKLCEDECGEGL